MRHGKLNDSTFGARMRGDGPFAESIHQMFDPFTAGSWDSPSALRLSTGFRRRPVPHTQFVRLKDAGCKTGLLQSGRCY